MTALPRLFSFRPPISPTSCDTGTTFVRPQKPQAGPACATPLCCPPLRDARALSRTSGAHALTAWAGALHRPRAFAGGQDIGWFPELSLPDWATDGVTDLLTDALHHTAADDRLPGLDIAIRILVDDIREVARSAAADAQLAAASGIDLHNPFLDPRVVDVGASVPSFGPGRLFTPTSRSWSCDAMTGVLPDRLAARTTKGSFNADHYTGMRANLPALLDLADGRLAALGFVDPRLLRAHLLRAAAGIPMSLATLEQALAAEALAACPLTAPRSPGPATRKEPSDG